MKWKEKLPKPLRTALDYWMAFGHFMSRVVNGILLTIVFVAIMPLVVLAQRLAGKDLLDLRSRSEVRGWKPRRRLKEDLESARHLF